MNEYLDDLIIDEETLDRFNFDIIDEKLIKFYSGYKLIPQIMDAERKGDEKLVKLCKIIQKTCELKLNPSSTHEPYSSKSKEALSDIFSQNDLDVLIKIISRVNCQAYRARLHDLCWLCCKPRTIKNAYNTIELYISYSIDAEGWISGVDTYYERALSLARQLGKGNLAKVSEIIEKLRNALALEYKDYKFMKLWIANLLIKFRLSNEEIERIAREFVLISQDLVLGNDYYTARSYLEYSAKSYQIIKDNNAWIETLIKIAETWELEALSRDQPAISMVFYENAIQAYRRVPKVNIDDNKISDLRLKLKDAGKAAISEMPIYTIESPDITDIIDSAIKHVSCKPNLNLALLYFCGLYSGVSKSSSIDFAMENIRFGVSSRLFSSIQLSGDGRKIGQDKPFGFTPDEVPEDTYMSDAVNIAVDNADFFVRAQLWPALNTISNEHYISLNMLENLCTSCPIIPENRTKLFAKGLFFGFEYDFATAAHLLIPQWEHMVRTVLKESNVHTTNLNDDGIDMEYGLSSLLDIDKAAEIFDEDLLFQMKVFLTHKRGPNLRNEIAHGLLDDNNSNNTPSIYWWWRSLKLVIDSLVNLSYAENNEDL